MAANAPEVQPERAPPPGNVGAPDRPADPGLDSLRDILLREDRPHIADLAARLTRIERRTSDDEALIATITPLLGDLIRRKVRDGRDEMVEALYPLIGQLVVRAVGEAMRDLARNIDFQLRNSLGFTALLRRTRARLRGVSATQLLLRQALPYAVTDVFLIHRASGLLLESYADRPVDAADSDLISAMLTAIRDFAHDAFGRGKTGQLDEIQYGDRRILIEAAQHAYLAVVVAGVEPPGYRSRMREQLIAFEHAHLADLRTYAGDAAIFAGAAPALRGLAAAEPPPPLGAVHKGLIAAFAGALIACVALTWMVGQALRQPGQAPRPALVVLAQPPPPPPPPSSTPLPSATPPPTATPSSTPTPALGVMTGDVFLHVGPAEETARLGMVIERRQAIEIMSLERGWYRVRWRLPGDTEVIGWTPAEWVATATPPAQP